MHSIRRILTRPNRGTRSRLQLTFLVILVSLLGVYLYNQRDESGHSDTVFEQNTIPLKRVALVTEKKIDTEKEKEEEKENLRVQSSPNTNNCAYQNCPKLNDDVINVHIICHTHLDPGWLNSVDGYFFGIQYARGRSGGEPYRHTMPSVLTIFNNVMGALLENSERRFVMVEMSFIWRWWKRLDEDYKNIIRKLMNQGRIDIAGGSWTSNDEAVSHYSAMIDQSTLGFRFLKTELRTCPQPAVAWQLDLFGHGKEINSLFAQMGYDGILFGRLDYQEKNERTEKKTLQMVWDVNENAPENERRLFTGILPNLYHPPETLALKSDVVGSLLRRSDTDTIPESVSGYSSRLLEELVKQQERYNSNNIVVIYGGDFEYEDATQYFQNIDAMIETINNMPQPNLKKRIRLHYSTPTCFLHALSRENRTWPLRQGDFMSYAHRAHAFWTGFYTSRPGIKFYERSLGSLHQSLRQLSLTAKQVDFNRLFSLSEMMGLLQHHDTITGTSPAINIEDILQRMYQTELRGHQLALSLYQSILTPSSQTNWSKPLIFCQLNESTCLPLTKLEKFSAIVYNPSSIPADVWLRIPVMEEQTMKLDTESLKKLSVDVDEIGTIPLSESLNKIPLTYKRNQTAEFIARVHVPPLSLQALPLKVTKTTEKIEPIPKAKNSCSIENEHYMLTVDDNGMVIKLKVKAIEKEINFQQYFGHYTSSSSDHTSHQQSGLYVFRPVGMNPPKMIDISEFYCHKREGYEEIIQVYSKYTSQSIRLLKKSPHIEFEWVVGRLDSNVEVVTTYRSSAVKNNGTFYTDSSGRSLMKRRRDQRDGYSFTQSIKTAGNYYPLVTGIIIKDEHEDLQLSVVTDRAEGGGSIDDGGAEIMIHRRVATDDGLGVSETLQEMGIDGKGLVVRGRHLVHVGKRDDGMRFYREFALKSAWKPIIAFRDDQNDATLEYKTWSLVKSKLPPQVNLLTVEPIGQEKNTLTVLFRIEHIYDKDEHSSLSNSITVNIRTIFSDYEVIDAREVTLGANMYKNEAFQRLKWDIDQSSTEKSKDIPESIPFDGTKIELRPMQIRSFFIKLKKI